MTPVHFPRRCPCVVLGMLRRAFACLLADDLCICLWWAFPPALCLWNAPFRWKEWTDLEAPEKERLPGEWRSLGEFDRLLVIRALRPGRITSAIMGFVKGRLGPEYIEQKPFHMAEVFKESAPQVFCVLVYPVHRACIAGT